MPVTFPFRSRMTFPIALTVPVEAGMMFWIATQPSSHSFPERSSMNFWVVVIVWAMVMSPPWCQSCHAWPWPRDQVGVSTGGIAANLAGAAMLFMVHGYHKHGGITRRSRGDEPFGSTLQVSPILLQSIKHTSWLHNIFSTRITPFYDGGILLLKNVDGLSVADKPPILNMTGPLNLPWIESH